MRYILEKGDKVVAYVERTELVLNRIVAKQLITTIRDFLEQTHIMLKPL